LHQIQKLLQYSPSLTSISTGLKKASISRRRFSYNIRVRGQANVERIEQFKEKFRSLPFDSILCIDETGFSNIGNVYYGYFKKGEYPVSLHTKNKQRRSCVVAISSSTVIHHKMQNKAYNTLSFVEFIRELMEKKPANITTFVMDNISFHKSKIIQEIADQNNINILFIPPYSPQFDPIEEVFAQLKKSFRSKLLEGVEFEKSILESIEYISGQSHFFSKSYDHTLHFCLE
jgi:transposase